MTAVKTVWFEILSVSTCSLCVRVFVYVYVSVTDITAHQIRYSRICTGKPKDHCSIHKTTSSVVTAVSGPVCQKLFRWDAELEDKSEWRVCSGTADTHSDSFSWPFSAWGNKTAAWFTWPVNKTKKLPQSPEIARSREGRQSTPVGGTRR